MEARARERFRGGLDNLHEVAVPRLYWRALKPELRRLFDFVSLGRPDPELAATSELQVLAPRGERATWLVIPRFARYLVCGHPEDHGKDYVYFGDDTLFLMASAQELVLSHPGGRVLDLCCGGGGVSLPLSDFDGSVSGIDLNPVAIELAHNCAQAQQLENYDFQHGDALAALQQPFDLVIGNPPTLSPELTGKEAFHATGSLELFLSILEAVVACLTPTGEAMMTVFSAAESNRDDSTFEQIKSCLQGKAGFQYRVRRHYPLGEGRFLRHVALHIAPQYEGPNLLELRGGLQLPALAWRRR